MENKYFNDLKENHKKILTVLAVVLTVFLAVMAIWGIVEIKNKIKEGRYIGREIETKNMISVSGIGEVFAKPDLALIDFSIITEAKTVAGALSENTKKMNSVLSFIKKQSVAENDLKTANFNIYPRYEYDNKGKRSLVGYEVNQSLEVKIRDLEKVGEIIGGAAELGVNQAGDLRFTIDKQDELKEEARVKAIKKAKEEAEKLAEELDIDLVRIVNFSESSAVPIPIYSRKAYDYGIGGGESVPQIETGENKIESNVTITYEIN